MKTWKQLKTMAKRQGRGIHRSDNRMVIDRGDVLKTPLVTITIDYKAIDDLDYDDMDKVLRPALEAVLTAMRPDSRTRKAGKR